MTCIIGFNNDKAYGMVADRQHTAGVQKWVGKGKIHKYKDFLLGVTGPTKISSVLDWWKCPKRHRLEDIDHYIRRTVYKSLRKFLEKEEVWGTKDDDINLKSRIIMSTKEGVYVLFNDMGVEKVSDRFECVGSGGDVAWGLMRGLWDDYDSDGKELNNIAFRNIIRFVSERVEGVSSLCDCEIRKK